MDDDINIGDVDDVTFSNASIRKNLTNELNALDDEVLEKEIKPLVCDQMKVYLRVRPFCDEEIVQGENQNCVQIESEHMLIAAAPKDSNTFKNSQHRQGKGTSQKFTFSKIFTEETSQKQFFDEAVLNTVREFVNGQNCLVFTYGVTNSGKTYTIQGVPKDVGILPRALDVIFNSIGDRQWEGPMLKPHMFCDVVRLRRSQEEEERKLKQSFLKLAECEDGEIDMTVNMSRSTADSTMSEDSLIRQSIFGNMSRSSNSSIRESGVMGELLMEPRYHDETAIDVESQGDIKFSIWVSFAEIYNENIYDLLEPLASKKKGTRSAVARPSLQLREDKNGTPYCRGLKEIFVTSADEAYKLLTVGKRNLQYACTKLNRNSSRSHCIFTIKMLRVVDTENPNVARMSMLSFCDLAGSERYGKTHSFGDRIKEAGNINTSLLTLGRCIQILRHNQTNKDHAQVVPFRDSKLTRLFQSFFCGKGRASMIVNINQCATMFDETLHALKYSAIAKQIIVVQEPEKPKRRTTTDQRFSVLLNQHSRDTIGWATPGACARVFAEEAALEEEDEDEDEDDEEETASETEREKELIQLLERMKQQLIEEKRKQLLLEMRIREEVCKEMSQQLVEIETHYSERLKREQLLLEEKAEKRMEILTQSVLKSRKRQRIFEDTENEEYISSVVLHAEQMKVRKLEKEMDDLKDKVLTLTESNEQLRVAADVAVKERNELQKENTSVKFQISDLEIKMEKSESSKVDQSLSQSLSVNNGELGTKLTETEVELDKQRQEVTKLLQVIDMLQCNSAESDNNIREMKKDMLKNDKKLTAVEEERDAMNLKIQELQRALDEKDVKGSGSNENQKQFEELLSTLEESTSQMEKLKMENEEQEDILHALREEITRQQIRYEELQASYAAGKVQEDAQMINESISNLKEQLSKSEQIIIQLKMQNETIHKELTQLKDNVVSGKEEKINLERQLNEAQVLVQSYESELESLKMDLESEEKTKGELKRLNDEMRLLQESKAKISEELKEALDLQKEYDAMDESKETQLQSAYAMQDKLKEDLKEAEKAIESFKIDVKKLHLKMEEAAVERKKELDLNLGSIAALKGEIDLLNVQIGDAKSKLEEIEKERDGLKIEVQRLEELVPSVDDTLAGSDLQEELSSLKDKALENESVLKSAKDKLKESEDKYADLEIIKQSLEEMIESLKRELVEEENKTATVCDLQEEVNTLRNKIIELQDKSVLSEDALQLSKDKLQETEENTSLEKIQLEDYIVKVNEQIEAIGDLSEKLKEKSAECEHLQEEVDMISSEKKNSDAKVSKLQCELKIQHDLLERENEKFEGRIVDFEHCIKDLEEKLTCSKKLECKNKQLAEEFERKYMSLQVSMEIMDEEIQAEREEHQELMNTTRMETLDKDSKITELENEVDKLTKQHSGQDLNKSELDAEIAELKLAISNLEKKLSDAEYNQQMASRQMRREKSNVEKLLKASEEAKEKLEKDLEEKQKELDDVKEKVIEGEKTQSERVEKHKSRAEKLEAVIKDMEICLKSSKDHEAKAISEIENFRLRCRRLETDCNNKEDTICSLTDEIDRFREESIMAANLSSSESNVQVESLRREVMEQKKSIDDLEFELRDLREEKLLSEREAVEKLTEAEKKISELDAFNADLDSKLKAAEEKRENLEKRVENLSETIEQMKSNEKDHEDESSNILNDLQCQLQEKSKEYEILRSDLEKASSEAAEVRLECDDLQERLHLARSELSSQTSINSKKIQNLEDLLEEKSEEIAKVQEELVVVTSKLSAAEELRQKKVELEMEVELLKSKDNELDAVKLLESELKSSRDQINNHVKTCSDLEDKCSDLEEQVEALRKSEEKLLSDLAEMKKLQERILHLEEECKDYQFSKMEVHELKSKVEEEKNQVFESQKIIDELKAKIQEQAPKVEECDLLQSQITIFEKQLTSLESSVKSSLHAPELEAQLEKEKTLREKAEKNLLTLQEEMDEIERKMMKNQPDENFQEELQKMKLEAKENNEKLQKEKAELENQIINLEKILQEKDKTGDIEKLQKKLDQLEKDQRSRDDSELDELRQNLIDTERKLVQTESRLKSIDEDLVKKDAKLKNRNETLSNFMSKMDEERTSYEVKLRDAASNEMVIEDLRRALIEQEAVMADQDKLTQAREETIEDLKADIEQILAKEREQLDTIKQLRTERESLDRKLKRFEDEKESSERQLKDLTNMRQIGDSQHEEIKMLQKSKDRAEQKLAKVKSKLEDAEKQLRDKNRYEQDLKDTIQELQTCERKLKEKEDALISLQMKVKSHEQEQSLAKQQHEDSANKDSQSLKILKTKFQAKEDLVRQLELEREEWKSRVEKIEELKAQELQKWRAERDKLVVQIEKIIKDKDKKLAESSSEHVADLEKQLEDKDAIIQELSSHLESGVRTRRVRHRTAGSSSGEDETEKMLELRRQLDQERMDHRNELNKVIKAKDCIIQDMRAQNQKLTSHISAEEASMSYASSGSTHVVNLTEDEPSTSLVKTRQKRLSHRKRKTSESESTEEESLKHNRRTMTRTSRHREQSHQSDENADPTLSVISEEGVIDLDDTTPKRASKCVLGNVTVNDTEDCSSPRKSTPLPAPLSKRKKRLKSVHGVPLLEFPVEQPEIEASVHPEQEIKRKLRTRRK